MSNGRHHRRGVRRGQLEQLYADALGQPPQFVRTLPDGDELWQRGQVAFVLPTVPLGASVAVHEAVERRRHASLDGRCACGGRLHLRRMHPGGISVQAFLHADDCPAADRNLAALLKREA